MAALLLTATWERGMTTITQWNFSTASTAINNSPAATTGIGTAISLGMTNGYTYSTTPTATVGSTTYDDLIISATTGANANEVDWRIRGGATGGTTGNGWNLAAPQYTQGAEFDVSTVGYTGITVTANWYSTAKGVRDLQEQYTTDGTTWTNIGTLQVANPNGYVALSIDLTGISAANNDANFGIRLVSAYDPTYTASQTYTSATLTSGNPVVYNNNSGNWRFGNITFTGTSTACYVAGTRILTEAGQVAVEDLAIGDRIVTLSGALRPIAWIGHRRIANPEAGQRPVRIAADTMAPGWPERDLFLSPDHAVFVEGVLVPIHALQDGNRIAPVDVAEVVYFHIMLATHDVIFAEGLPAETLLDNDLGRFDNAEPGEADTMTPCAPIVAQGARLEAIRRHLADHVVATV